ncbi:MAG: gluconate 2-dehydrogenase subunit 3 family protein [Campylobacterales bacterium]|nr:gluconate 2-dehydrogenase subunit 3 family protein [Campylobacterales bacterium]
MKRRVFLLFTFVLLIGKSFGKGLHESKIVMAVLYHLFPTTPKYSGAKAFGIVEYLRFITRHPSFSAEDLRFLFDGAAKLQQSYPPFLLYPSQQKENALRAFEKTPLGNAWLTKLLYYGLEAMLGDPIYGGNKDRQGWKNFNLTPPQPTAKTPFGKASV